MAAICVYCGSSPGDNPAYARAARDLGEAIAASGHALVYGGSNVGLMTILADAAMAKGGRVIGVIPTVLVDLEKAHRGITELRTVATMTERRQLMMDLSDAFIAMPGGIGTLDELSEVMVMNQLGLQLKAVGLLNVAGFFDPLIGFFKRMVEARFFKAEQLDQLLVRGTPARLIADLLAFKPRPVAKWLDENASPVGQENGPGR